MQDVLTTLTRDEVATAKERSRKLPDRDAHGDDCYQLWLYSKGAIFKRGPAERALSQIRGLK